MIVRDENAFEAALLSDDNYRRVQARASDATWVHGFGEWVNAEMNRPDFEPIDLIAGSFAIFMSLHASVAGHYIPLDMDRDVLDRLKAMLDESYSKLFFTVHRNLAALHQQEVAQ